MMAPVGEKFCNEDRTSDHPMPGTVAIPESIDFLDGTFYFAQRGCTEAAHLDPPVTVDWSEVTLPLVWAKPLLQHPVCPGATCSNTCKPYGEVGGPCQGRVKDLVMLSATRALVSTQEKTTDLIRKALVYEAGKAPVPFIQTPVPADEKIVSLHRGRDGLIWTLWQDVDWKKRRSRARAYDTSGKELKVRPWVPGFGARLDATVGGDVYIACHMGPIYWVRAKDDAVIPLPDTLNKGNFIGQLVVAE